MWRYGSGSHLQAGRIARVPHDLAVQRYSGRLAPDAYAPDCADQGALETAASALPTATAEGSLRPAGAALPYRLSGYCIGDDFNRKPNDAARSRGGS